MILGILNKTVQLHSGSNKVTYSASKEKICSQSNQIPVSILQESRKVTKYPYYHTELSILFYITMFTLWQPIGWYNNEKETNENEGKGRKETYLIVFMCNSLPLWLIAISQGSSPLCWVWGKCCRNLIQQLCVVSPWGGPLHCLLPRWLTKYVSYLPFPVSPSSFVLCRD